MAEEAGKESYNGQKEENNILYIPIYMTDLL